MSYRADKQVIGAHTDGHTDKQTQATTIPEGQNWPRVKKRKHNNEHLSQVCVNWMSFIGYVNTLRVIFSYFVSNLTIVSGCYYQQESLALVIAWRPESAKPLPQPMTVQFADVYIERMIKCVLN